MKNWILLLPGLFCCISAISQDTKVMKIVGKPKRLDNSEMVARVDGNGKYCAAIQVISTMDGFSYGSNDGLVGDVTDNPGKDMVFLTATERALEVFKLGYKPLKIILSEYGIDLNPGEVWQIEIVGEGGADKLPVTFVLNPPDAVLTVDGKITDISSPPGLAIGQHTIRITKDGYQPIEETINVNEKNVYFNRKLEKEKDAGLQIESTPEGASVYLDDVKLGETPVAAFYKPGNYYIKIVKEGYVTIENQTLEVKLPQTRKGYTLEENVGYLTVNTHVGATVYFNDKKIDNPKNVKLAPQLVKVKVTMPKAETLEQQVTLKRKDKLMIDLYPEVKTGSIQVAVTPFDAKIELTGDAGEKFTAVGLKNFEDIPTGNYTIQVSAGGYTAANESVTVKQGEATSKTIKLEKPVTTTPGGTSTTTTTDGFEMVFVKGGTFTMGCTSEQSDCYDNEKPTHQVTLIDFYIGKYEVA